MSTVRALPVAPAYACRDDCRAHVLVGAHDVAGLEGTGGDPPCPRCLRAFRGLFASERLVRSFRAQGAGKRQRRRDEFDPCPPSEIVDSLAAALDDVSSGRSTLLFVDVARRPRLIRVLGDRLVRLLSGATLVRRAPPEVLLAEVLGALATQDERAAQDDIASADLAVVWGADPRGGLAPRDARLARALDSAERVVVIDSYETASARQASLAIAPRPGTEGALALALVALAGEGCDERRIGRFADEARAWSPDRAARVTGVSEDKLQRVVRALAEARSIVFVPGMALASYPQAASTIGAVVAAARAWRAKLHAESAPVDPLRSLPVPPSAHEPHVLSAGGLVDELERRDATRDVVMIAGGDPLVEMPHAAAALAEYLRRARQTIVFASEWSAIHSWSEIVVAVPSPVESPDVVGRLGDDDRVWIAEQAAEAPREALDPARLLKRAARQTAIPGAWLPESMEELQRAVLDRLALGPLPTTPGAPLVVTPRYQESGEGPVTTPAVFAGHPLALIEEDAADERAAPVLVMSRETARARGLEGGDLAVIHNERARLSARVRIAETTDHGVVVLIRSDASSTAVQAAWVNAPGRGLLAENPGRPLVDVARAEAV